MEEFILKISYKNDREVELGAESLSEAIQYGLKLLGKEEGTISIYKRAQSVGVPRITKAVLVTTIKQVSEEPKDPIDLLTVLLDELWVKFNEAGWWSVWDRYQQIGALLQETQALQQRN